MGLSKSRQSGAISNLLATPRANPYNYSAPTPASLVPPTPFPHGTYNPQQATPGIPQALNDWLVANSGPPGLVQSQQVPQTMPAQQPIPVPQQAVPQVPGSAFQAWLAANQNMGG